MPLIRMSWLEFQSAHDRQPTRRLNTKPSPVATLPFMKGYQEATTRLASL